MRRSVLLGWSFFGLAHPNSTTPISPKAAGIFHLQSQVAQGCSEPVWDEGCPAEKLCEAEVLGALGAFLGELGWVWDGMALKPLCCQQRDIPCSVSVLPLLEPAVLQGMGFRAELEADI